MRKANKKQANNRSIIENCVKCYISNLRQLILLGVLLNFRLIRLNYCIVKTTSLSHFRGEDKPGKG